MSDHNIEKMFMLTGKKYIFGKYSFLKKAGLHMGKTEEELHEFSDNEGKIIVFLSDGQAVLGYAVFADILRPEIKQAFHEMSDHNIEKMFMLTGDKEAVAKKAAAALGIAEYRSEMLPEDKVLEVEKIKTIIRPVAMVGDGINDAPALAAADVGIALAGHGSSAASEAGDIVIMVNNFMRVHDALHIAQETMKIAKQSIFVGMGLSVAAMVAASLGYLPPVYGALLQEAIDVAVILNALRVNFVKV
jgi:P-type E1-E2 ATPase